MVSRKAARTGVRRSARRHEGPAHAGDRTQGPPPEAADDPHARARQICLRLLTAKARTRAELARALARRGIDDEAAEEVLARFCEVGLIDDVAFAQGFVHSGHTHHGLGRRALAAQLHRRGVDAETTGEAVAAVDGRAEEEMARTLVRRGLAGSAGADDAATVRRLVGVLARRGYPEGLSYRVVRDELRAAGRSAAALDDVSLDD